MKKEKRNKLNSIIFISVGVVIIFVAATLVIYNAVSLKINDKNNRETVSYFDEVLPTYKGGPKDGRTNLKMPIMLYDSEEYVAILEVKDFNIKLPVAANWDEDLLDKMPCRYLGNPYDGSLSIGGVYKEGQFNFISELDISDKIVLRDMSGGCFSYSVAEINHTNDLDKSTVTNKNSDLTLFTHNDKLHNYTLIRCNLI